MKLKAYSPNDVEEIRELFTKTFSNSEGHSEGLLIGQLSYNLLTATDVNNLYAFVAVEDGQIIGCIIFSRLSFDSAVNVFILSPVAIHTRFQRMGIGQKLINFGLAALKEDGVELVFTYGDPNYYSKTGFNIIDEKTVKAPLTLTYPEGWLGQSLNSDKVEPIPGRASCVEALNKPELW